MRFTRNQVEQLREEFPRSGLSLRAFARQHKVSASAMCEILNGRVYRGTTPETVVRRFEVDRDAYVRALQAAQARGVSLEALISNFVLSLAPPDSHAGELASHTFGAANPGRNAAPWR
jgi:hypothetical protein